ncbi:uncharacterized protein H6S33_008371 [Morchella sextelata]|uniref:uncharacterized protein n=1 Tax=Morchella sextelata TaxID=1174677 RepID=UPI001D05B249|nr:uncharacterized protein H6S33_008371 [Morchella sextelata]KAH0602721.1 hypothetical protein H6S33_008371 [Morchella sextelata]
MSSKVYSLITDLTLLTSEIIEVSAESGNRKFFVHKDILTSKSNHLRSIMSSVWKEVTEKKIDFSDWDGDTVGRFLQFMYVDDYQIHEPNREEFEPEFAREYHRASEPFDCICKELFRSENINVLLLHTKVYALAQYKDVEVLQMLALNRIEDILSRIPPCLSTNTLETALTEKIIKYILEVLSYIYENICTREYSDEPIRRLFLDFVAKNIRLLNLKDREDVWTLLGEGGDLTTEMLRTVIGRLVEVELRLEVLELDSADNFALYHEKVAEFEGESWDQEGE